MMRNDIQPYIPKCGLRDCKIAIIGEAPGEQEVKEQQPFVGKSGKLLNECLSDLEQSRESFYITNVFWERPPDNKVDYFFVSARSEQASDKVECSFKGKKIKKEYETEIFRLRTELYNLNPKIIIALGATPTWALTGADKITMVRGTLTQAHGPVNLPRLVVMPTYHPSFVLRNRVERKKILLEDIKLALNFEKGL